MRILLLLLAFFNMSLYASSSLVIHSKDENTAQRIREFISQPFVLETLSCQADVLFSEKEFRYLTELKEGTQVRDSDLIKAVSYLFKKNKFESITLEIHDAKDGKNLHVVLKSFWTFKRVKIHGVLIDKDAYLQHYLMESGDPFDHNKHVQSLQKIVEVFHAQGYCDASIETVFKRDNVYKQARVDIYAHRGKRFSIEDVSLVIKKNERLKDLDAQEIQTKIYHQFCKRLIKNTYDKSVLSKETAVLKKLLESWGYLDSSIELTQKINHENKTVSLTFEIELNQKKIFIFQGNQFLSNQELMELIKAFGPSVLIIPPSMLCQEIKEAYHAQGFWDAHISVSELNDHLYFNIQEGHRVTLSSVILKHAQTFDNSVLVEHAFGTLIHSKFYNAENLKDGINALIAWYLKAGYLDAKILKHDYIKMRENDYQLVVTIDEGPRYFIQSIAIDPFKELIKKGPFLEFHLQKGALPCDAHILATQKKWLSNHFLDQGYAHVEVKPEIKKEQNVVSIIWHVSVSEHKMRFGKTVVVGSARFPFEYILREMAYKKGAIWDKNALKQSFLNLKSLEVFEHIHLFPDVENSSSQERPVIVKVQEDEPFEVRLRGGLELQNFVQRYTFEGITYLVGGAFIIKSPLDAGDQLRIDGEFARVHREFIIKYQRPWIYDIPLKTVFTGYANAYDQPGFIGSPINIYTLYQNGALFGVSRVYAPFEFGITCGFEWMKTVIPDRSDQMNCLIGSIARAIEFNPLLLNQSVPFFQIEPTVILDCLDNKLNPTCGSFSLLSFKGMFPLRCAVINTNLIKATLEQSFFMPLWSTVLALRLRAGHIFGRKFESIMPNERFYLGGANSMRGYQTDSAGPLGIFTDGQGCLQYAPKGGRTMMNANAEIRFPLYKNLGGVIFQDIGALSSCGFADFQPDALLASTGFGLRVNTPMGPLRFDMGWKWDREASWIKNFAWFLAFGQAF